MISTHYPYSAIRRISHFSGVYAIQLPENHVDWFKKVNGKKLKLEDFDLVKDSISGRAVYAKIHSGKSGKAKCRISLGSPNNTINIEELVDKNFERSFILKLYHAYLGSTRSTTLSVEEIFVKEISTMESYFSESDTESEEEYE